MATVTDGKVKLLILRALEGRHDFTAPTEIVKMLWAMPAPPDAPIINVETRCRRYLVHLMKVSMKRQLKQKREYLEEYRQLSNGLSERAFDRAWKAAIDETGAQWMLPGALKKST